MKVLVKTGIDENGDDVFASTDTNIHEAIDNDELIYVKVYLKIEMRWL